MKDLSINLIEFVSNIETNVEGLVAPFMDKLHTENEVDREEIRGSEQEIRLNLENLCHSVSKQFMKGYSILLNDAWQTKSNLLPYLVNDKIFDKIGNQVEIEKEIRDGANLWDIFGFTEDVFDTFYTTALYLLEHHKYQEAEDAFFCLSLMRPNIAPLWQGLARCKSALNHKQEALKAYKAALLIEGNNFNLYSEAIRCAMEGNCGKELGEVLDIAIEYAQHNVDDPSSQALHNSAAQLKKELSWMIQ